jgi:hypothetical protein
LAVIAEALAADINMNAADAFTAVADGDVLVIVNREGDIFVTRFSVAGVEDSDADDRFTPVTTSLDLNGTPAAAEVWSVKLDDGSSSSTHTHVVTSTDTLADIVQALADDINTNGDAAFAAVAEGDGLLMHRARPAGRSPSLIRRSPVIRTPVWRELWPTKLMYSVCPSSAPGPKGAC